MKIKIVMFLIISLFSSQAFAIKESSGRKFIRETLPIAAGLGIVAYLVFSSDDDEVNASNFDFYIKEDVLGNNLLSSYSFIDNYSKIHDVYISYQFLGGEDYKFYGLSIVKSINNNFYDEILGLRKNNLYGVGFDFNINQSEKLNFEYLKPSNLSQDYFSGFSINYNYNF